MSSLRLYQLLGLFCSIQTTGILFGLQATVDATSYIPALSMLLISALLIANSILSRRINKPSVILCLGVVLIVFAMLSTGIFNSSIVDEALRASFLVILLVGVAQIKPYEQEAALRFFTILPLFAMLVTLVTGTGPINNGRLSISADHNTTGLAAAAVSWAAMLSMQRKQRKWTIFSITAVILSVYVTYKVDSRGGMFFSFSSISLLLFKDYPVGIKNLLGRFASTVPLALTLVLVFSHNLSDLLSLEDEHRGLNTGISGRIKYSQSALEEIHNFTFLGVGSGKGNIVADGPLDNAYLSCWVEIGFFGLLGYLMILGASILSPIFTLKFNRIWFFAVFYLLYGLVESRYITFGNPISPVFFLTILSLHPLRMDSNPT